MPTKNYIGFSFATQTYLVVGFMREQFKESMPECAALLVFNISGSLEVQIL